MNGKKCVKQIVEHHQKRPLFRRMGMGREPRPLQILSFGKPKARPTVVPRYLLDKKIIGLEHHERRLAEQQVDKNMNIALKMNNDERMEKYGAIDMKNIHEKLFNIERKKIISMREKKMKAPECPAPMPIKKIVSPQQLIKEFLRNSPVQIIRPRKTISQMMRETPKHVVAPQVPKGGVYDRIAKKAGLKIAKPKQTKAVKAKPPVALYEKERCSKRTSNKPYTVSELRRIAKSMNISKEKIADAKTSVRKLCALIDDAPKMVIENKNNLSMKRRLNKAKEVMRKEQNKAIKNHSKKNEHKKIDAPWMDRTSHSRKRHKNAMDDVYTKALATLKKDNPVMFLKMKGFNAGRVGRKTKVNPDPHRQNNLIQIARELNINVPTTSKKPKPTATQLIALIKKKLEKD